MKLPLILSGPIIRRVDPKEIYIWIALSKPLQVDAKLYEISRKKTDEYTYEMISDYSNTESFRLGKNLHIYLIKILPLNHSFPTQTLLGYNLFFKKGTRTINLDSFQLLSPQNPNSIVYGNLKYPSFYINNSSESKILYGSCRNMHGKGNDSLANADKLLEREYINLEERPDSLFLMGDQIYADDVADPIFPALNTLGETMMGKRENLTDLDSRLNLNPFNYTFNKIHARQFVMEKFCKFTSRNAHNHMVTFGEYSAMYLMSWGPQLWDLAFNSGLIVPFEKVLEQDDLYFIFPDDPEYKKERQKELEQHEQNYNEQLADLYLFFETLPRIRRVLANTPTYMIFDDHDITDDWNISATWKENVWNAPLGRHVVSNGLAAYWAFQGWGNDPDRFDMHFLRTMENYFNNLDVKSRPYRQWASTLWNFHHWHFVTPGKRKALFLDTRTLRFYEPIPEPFRVGNILEENTSSPCLISKEGWDLASNALKKSGWVNREPLILVSPTPLYGIEMLESFLLNYIYPLKIIGIPVQTALDFEAWKYNRKAINLFMHQLFEWDPSDCIILSGDVHFAASATSKVTFKDGREKLIRQFISSPLNNMSFSGIGGSLLKLFIWLNSYKRKKEILHRFCDLNEKVYYESENTPCPSIYNWKEEIQYLPTEHQSIIETENNVGLLSITQHVTRNSLLQFSGNQVIFESPIIESKEKK